MRFEPQIKHCAKSKTISPLLLKNHDNMRYYTTILAVIVSLTAFGQTEKTITVRGTSTSEINPEKIELSIVYRYSDNVKDNDKANAQETSLLRVLNEFEVSKESLIVDNLSAYGWGGFSKVGNNTISLTKTYRLKVANPSIIDNLLPKLVQTGADNVSIISLESSKLDSAKQVTMTQALDNARAKAQTIAKHMTVQIGNPLSIIEIFPNKTFQIGERGDYLNKMGINVRGSSTFQDTETETLNMRKIRISTTYEIQFEIK